MQHVTLTSRDSISPRFPYGPLTHSIFEPLAGCADLQGLDAGLHAFLALAPGIPAGELEPAALERGVRVVTLDEYFHGAPDRNGILLGYGGLTLDQIERGANILAGIIREHSKSDPRRFSVLR